MRRILLALLVFGFSVARGGGLENPRNIDIVRVSSSSGQVFLYVVLDPDEFLQRPAILAKLRTKLDLYKRYVTSGQVWKDEARANRDMPVVLGVIVSGEMSNATRAALETLKSEYEIAPTAFIYEHRPHKKAQ